MFLFCWKTVWLCFIEHAADPLSLLPMRKASVLCLPNHSPSALGLSGEWLSRANGLAYIQTASCFPFSFCVCMYVWRCVCICVYVCVYGVYVYECVCMHVFCSCYFFNPGTHIYDTGVLLLKYTHPAPSLEWVKLLSCKILQKILNDKHQPLFCHHIGKYNILLNGRPLWDLETITSITPWKMFQFSILLNCNIKSLKVCCCKHRKAVLVHGCGTVAPQDIHILAPRTRGDYPPVRKHFSDMIKLRVLGGKDGSGFSGWA